MVTASAPNSAASPAVVPGSSARLSQRMGASSVALPPQNRTHVPLIVPSSRFDGPATLGVIWVAGPRGGWLTHSSPRSTECWRNSNGAGRGHHGADHRGGRGDGVRRAGRLQRAPARSCCPSTSASTRCARAATARAPSSTGSSRPPASASATACWRSPSPPTASSSRRTATPRWSPPGRVTPAGEGRSQGRRHHRLERRGRHRRLLREDLRPQGPRPDLRRAARQARRRGREVARDVAAR